MKAKGEKRLRDKIWREATIKIDRIVAQTKRDITIENRTIGYLVEINYCGTRIGFREDNPKKLWERIREEVYLLRV